jgi:hypothetical protein
LGGGRSLEADGRRCQERSDAHPVEASSNGARKAAPCLGVAMDAFDTPSMPLMEALLPLCPWESLAPLPQQSRVIGIEETPRGWR